MNRLSLFAIASLLFVACGGDGGNHNSGGVCGDGVVGSGEQCDDGNTSNGDGCSSTCQKESSPSTCGDGTLDVATETCDDGNTVSGDGCSATCQKETPPNLCGNGAIDGSEACDDGNTAAGDGCSQACVVEMGWMCTGTPSHCTMTQVTPDGTCAMPNVIALAGTGTLTGSGSGDTTTATDQVMQARCDTYSMDDRAPDQIWTFTTTDVRDVTITLDAPTSGDDTALRLTTVPCDLTTSVAALPGDDGCVDAGGSAEGEVMTQHALPAGTYYVVVDGYNVDDVGPYTLSISAAPSTCGNGTVESGEGCDDHNTTATDGCDARCQIETGYVCTGAPSTCHAIVCGDGIIEGTEVCDDHNTAIGDGCNAMCQIEPGYGCSGLPSACSAGGTCAMPFDLALTGTGGSYSATATSDDSASTDQVAATTCDTESSAGAAPDQQWKFVNPVAQPVTITLVGSATNFDGVIRLMTTACDATTQVPDDDGVGTSDGCSDQHGSGTSEVLSYGNLAAGTYYIDIDGYSAAAFGHYTFEVHAGAMCGDGIVEAGEECDAGGTTSDRCTADCHLIFDTTDTEANDDMAHAQILTPVHHIIKGSLPVGDLDVYQFTLTAASTVSVETYTTYESSYTSTSDSSVLHLKCPSADTIASVFDGTGDVTDDSTALDTDDDSGDGHCSYVTSASLAAGTYYFVVHEYQQDDVIARYLADFTVTP